MALQKDEDGNLITPTVESPWTMTLNDPASPSTGKQAVTDPAIDPTTTSTGATTTPTTPPAATPSTPAASSTPAPTDAAGIIDSLYSQYGLKDYGRGSGFADRAYWLEHPDQVVNGRLGRDIAGTGTDQPTGTPGYGPWVNSGRTAPEAAVGQPTRDSALSFWLASGNNPNVNNPGTAFAPGGTRPSSPDPPGYHWDDSQARYVADSATPTTPATSSSTTTGASTPTGAAGVTAGSPSGGGQVPDTLGTVNPGGSAPPLPQAGSSTTAEPTIDYRTQLLNMLTGGAGGQDPFDQSGTARP
jgi:hypothetical protein